MNYPIILQPTLQFSAPTFYHNHVYEFKILIPVNWRQPRNVSPAQIYDAGVSARACKPLEQVDESGNISIEEIECKRCGKLLNITVKKGINPSNPPFVQPDMHEEYIFTVRPLCSSTRNHIGINSIAVVILLEPHFILISIPLAIRAKIKTPKTKPPNSPPMNSSSSSPQSSPNSTILTPPMVTTSQQQQQQQTNQEMILSQLNPLVDAPIVPYNVPVTLVSYFGTKLHFGRCQSLLNAFLPLISRQNPGFSFATFIPLSSEQQNALISTTNSLTSNSNSSQEPNSGTFPLFTIACFNSLESANQGSNLSFQFCGDLFSSGSIQLLSVFRSWK